MIISALKKVGDVKWLLPLFLVVVSFSISSAIFAIRSATTCDQDGVHVARTAPLSDPAEHRCGDLQAHARVYRVHDVCTEQKDPLQEQRWTNQVVSELGDSLDAVISLAPKQLPGVDQAHLDISSTQYLYHQVEDFLPLALSRLAQTAPAPWSLAPWRQGCKDELLVHILVFEPIDLPKGVLNKVLEDFQVNQSRTQVYHRKTDGRLHFALVVGRTLLQRFEHWVLAHRREWFLWPAANQAKKREDPVWMKFKASQVAACSKWWERFCKDRHVPINFLH